MSTTASTTDPLVAWQRLRAGAERPTAVRGPAAGPPEEQPVAAVFRCADTCLANEAVFGQAAGSLIDVSTWGHVVDTGVLATLEYAVESLGVPLIVVLGHRDCPAMRAAMRAWTDTVIPDGAARTVVENAIGSIVRRGAGAESLAELTSAHIADTGLGLLERSPVIAREVGAGRLAIVCVTTDSTGGGIAVHATIGAVGEVDGALLECV